MWFGLQPFYGEFGANSASHYTYSNYLNAQLETSVDGSLSGHVLGALLTAQKDFHPSQKVRVFVSGGVGGYSATSSATISGMSGDVELNRSATFQGLRGQLAIGADYKVNSHLSFGTVSRLDFWSAFPSMTGKYSSPNGGEVCFRESGNGELLCYRPQDLGKNDISGAPLANLFVGASLTLRP